VEGKIRLFYSLRFALAFPPANKKPLGSAGRPRGAGFKLLRRVAKSGSLSKFGRQLIG
jgi:hypothetical protein